ncbi:hypothetical protein JKF63_05451 [Porcisia hertigi]|uniref:EF-hand domain-containing protein n=1 Tax=Porcisia hertigi TaxID=2761500 RepID=A0A836IVX9_9TRYP|nr:hypothetical protein JKF63_05451 [Porcisia hertigi]
MRQDGQMGSQLQCSFEGVNEKPLAQLSPRMHPSRPEEESRLQRGGNANGGGSTSPTTASSSGFSNSCSGESALTKHRSFAPSSSPGILAPPSTPSPHYGFRRNTANIMAAGRRVSHRSSSAPSVVSGDRGVPHGSWSGSAEALLPSPRNTNHTSGAPANGSADRGSNWGRYGDHLDRSSRSGLRSANEVGGDAGTGFTAPMTLPNSHGHLYQYTGASGGMVGASAAGDRCATLRDSNVDYTFQINDSEAAVTPLEGRHSVTEFDRRTGYHYPMLGRTDISSPTCMLIEKLGSSSRYQHERLSPRSQYFSTPPVALPSAEIRRPASPERGTTPSDMKENGEEAKGRRHRSRHAGVTTSLAVESLTRASAFSAAPSLSPQFVGFTLSQQQRFESLQGRGPPGREIARWKMLELMRYWMSMPSTRGCLDTVIRDALVDAGIAKAKEAWGGGDARVAASRPSASSDALQQAGGFSQLVAPCASPPSIEEPPVRVSPKSKVTAKMAALERGNGPLSPSADSEGDKRRPGRTRNDMIPVVDEVHPPLTSHVAPASAPTSPAVSLAVSSSAPEERSSTPPPGGVNPMAAAAGVFSAASTRRHRPKSNRGVIAAEERFASPPGESISLPPRDVKEHMDAFMVSQTPEAHVASVMQRGQGISSNEAASCERTDVENDARAFQHHETGQLSLHPSPSEVPPTNSTRTSASRHHRNRRSKSRAALSRREATYEEIPQFYFPLGRLTMREEIISGPLYAKHENPFLKIADGVAMSAPIYDGGESSRLGASAEALVGTGDDSLLFSQSRQAQRVAAMSQLHALDDRQVGHYIQREFGRLPPFPRHSQRVRLLGGRLRSGGRHHSSLPFAKQELLYKQQFVQCMQRLCGHCFGIPRYFAFLIMRLIKWELHKGDVEVPGDLNLPQTRQGHSRLASSSSLLSHTTNGSGCATGIPSVFLITAQNMKEFYEAHLKSKDPVRRIFDLLILSSYLPTSSRAGGSLAGISAAPEENDQSASPSGTSLSALPLRPYLLPQDFVAYINILLTYHPGLAFLRQTPDFQLKYLDTVIYRIFYELDRFDRGRIRYSELAASRLIDAFRQVDSAEDINVVLPFFSYEHFYVLYCRFWELDEDRDMLLAPEDLMRYAPEDVMNPCIVQRIFAGVGRRRRCSVPYRISYEDFVWFCLSEEDKSTPQAIRYWFRVLDLDGDGILSLYELRVFYDATRCKIAEYVQEGLVSFEDVVCQVFDMMRCSEYRGLSLSDLLREPQAAAVALNLLTNVVKFLQFEQRDPFVLHHERLLGGPEQSTWDHFARVEYDRMALEADRLG